MKVQIPTNSDRFLQDYLNTVNGILKLTKTEIKVCMELIKTNLEDPCSIENRKQVAANLKWGRAILNNSIKSLKDKKVLVYNRDSKPKYTFHPIVYNYKNADSVNFEFVMQDGEILY
jgi:predicted transcriptional regulator|tara:strand:+ start:4133 stop:4483 length:351 start_codon:yes stop_codon:yes gene_type:complete